MAMMDHDRISLAHEDEQTTRSVIAGGSTVAAIAGLAGGVLALLGLLDMRPDLFAAIATICIGAAFLIEGGAIASRVSSLRSKTAIRHKWRSALKPAPLLSWLCRYEGESA